ncbi:MAG: NRDE family protein [Gemmataceae bacterium]|nr:NRDE family protein [Gemmataceae bacterium]
MCLLALFFRAVDDAPLIAGANREESYARPGEPPRLLDGPCRAAAGIDPTAGGTWLGVNEFGVLAAVTNRPRASVPAQPRSRGLLVRDLLGCPSAAAAQELATRELSSGRYAGCNIVVADSERAVVLHAAEWLRVQMLPPGLHVLANRDINQESDPRVGYSLWWLGQRNYARADDCVTALKELCASCGGEGPPICLHGQGRGTVSSSILVLPRALARGTYLHAQGSPDRTPYEDYSDLLRQLATPEN